MISLKKMLVVSGAAPQPEGYTICVQVGVAGAEVGRVEAERRGHEHDDLRGLTGVDASSAIQSSMASSGVGPPGPPEWSAVTAASASLVLHVERGLRRPRRS